MNQEQYPYQYTVSILVYTCTARCTIVSLDGLSNYEFRLNTIVFIIHEWPRTPADNNKSEMVKITDM